MDPQKQKRKTTGALWRALTVFVRVITFGKVDLDPHFRIDAEDLRRQIAEREAELTAVRAHKAKAADELSKIEAKVRQFSRENKAVPQEDLFAVMLLRREIAAHDRNEAMLCKGIIIGRENLAMIQLLGYSKPISIRPQVSKISDRLQIQIDGIHVDQDISGQRTNDVAAAVSIEALQAQLEDIRLGIVGDEPESSATPEAKVVVTPVKQPDLVATDKAERRQDLRVPQADAARASVGKAKQADDVEFDAFTDDGYEPVGEEDDDEPPACEREAVPA